MFFSITHGSPDTRFFINHKIKDFYVNLDAGWKEKTINDTTIFYKGYCDYVDLDNIVYGLINDPVPSAYGNFCAIIYNNDNFCITHDIQRHFPIWNYDNLCLTNLSRNNEYYNFRCNSTKSLRHIPEREIEKFFSIDYNSNSSIPPGYYIKKYNNNGIETCEYKIFDSIKETKTVDTCSKEILDLLSKKSSTFNNSNLNKKIFLSGGLDTMLVYALLNSPSEDLLIFNENIDMDDFLTKNYDYLSHTHGYYSTHTYHHWTTPTFLTSGGGGGYSFFKEYYIVATWYAYHDIDFLKLHAESNFRAIGVYSKARRRAIENAYKNRKYIQDRYPSYESFCKYLLDVSLINYQHHHCGNTIMWTPLQDIRILQKILSMSHDDINDQIMHCNIENYIFNKKNKNLLNYFSTEKLGRSCRNLTKFPPFQRYLKQILKDKKTDEIEIIRRKLFVSV